MSFDKLFDFRLTHRVDRMEQSIGSIVSKIDAVLVKLVKKIHFFKIPLIYKIYFLRHEKKSHLCFLPLRVFQIWETV